MATGPAFIYGDTANAVLNTARSRIDDLILTPAGSPAGTSPGLQDVQVGGGNLLAELNADGSLCLRTQIIFNSAYRKMQKYLANLGYRLFTQDNVIISSIPANTNGDPTIQSWISWNGSYNGATFTATPALPSNFLAPLKMRERISGQDAVFIPMRCALDGLRELSIRTVLNRQWEWRGNALYLPGANGLTDIELRYTTWFPDLVANLYTTGAWYLQPLPIPQCLSALAWYIAVEVCFPRGDEDGFKAAFAQAQGEADLIFNDQARADQRTNNRRRPRAGGRASRHGYRFGL